MQVVPAPAQIDLRIAACEAELVAFLRKRAPAADAEEIAQDVWLRVHRANPDCADLRSFRAYAYAVARRLLIDRHRRRSTRPQLVPIDGDLDRHGGGTRPDQHAAAGDVLRVVEAVLASMKPEIAQVFRWRTSGDLSFKEIAARQGVPLNTALGRHHRATKKIQAALAEQGLVNP